MYYSKVISCPFCMSKNITDLGNSPNGGEIYVAEDMVDSTEGYDFEITEYNCDEGHIFYANPQPN
jgi:hypothetical protein